MPAGPTLRERQAGYSGLRMLASFYCIQHATFVNWVLVNYTLANQLNLNPCDLDAAL